MNANPPEMTADFDAKALLADLTEAPGVYRFLDAAGAVLYVGKAKNLKKRVSTYFQKTDHSPRIQLMLQQVAQVEITATRSETEALILENTLIKRLSPKYNILFRDDKSYPYIVLSKHEFPRLAFHRGAMDKRARYFGPFPSGSAVRESLRLLQKTFLLRTCENSVFAHRSRPCLLHQIHLCKAPCVGGVSAEEYSADVRLATLLLSGKSDEVIAQISQSMNAAAAQLDFETAAQQRDQIRALQSVLHRQYVSSGQQTDADIIAIASASHGLCLNLAMVRGGLHLGDRAFFPGSATAEGITADHGEALFAFVSQHYLEHIPPPRLLLTPDLLASLVAQAQAQASEKLLRFPGGNLCLKTPQNEMERAWLGMAEQNARLSLISRLNQQRRAGSSLAMLAETLNLPEPPQRIECFDISHTLGEGTVASCVVCVDGVMKKSAYRRYNINDITPGDDYAAMRQALSRRYEKVASGDSVAPDLILIDGGKGQQSMARAVLAELNLEHLPSLGIAKGETRKPGLETLFLHNMETPLHLPEDHPALHLIQEIRDEAHRFAIAGHRARRARSREKSRLEDIPGIGPARRRTLLAHCGGLDGVRAATVEDLKRVSGISQHLAESIYAALHPLSPENPDLP
jgi:excinuclease ABC subunit C